MRNTAVSFQLDEKNNQPRLQVIFARFVGGIPAKHHKVKVVRSCLAPFAVQVDESYRGSTGRSPDDESIITPATFPADALSVHMQPCNTGPEANEVSERNSPWIQRMEG